MDEQCQTLRSQIDLLEQELQTAHVERGLSKGRLEAAKADHQVRHLWLGQMGARAEQIRIRTDLVHQDCNAPHGPGPPFLQAAWCNPPTPPPPLVSSATAHYNDT